MVPVFVMQQSCVVLSCCPDYMGVRQLCLGCEVEAEPPHWDAEDAGVASFCIVAVPRVCAMNS